MTLQKTPQGWRARISVAGADGRPKRVYFRGATKTIARDKANAFLRSGDLHNPQVSMTVEQVCKLAIKRAESREVRENTLRVYRGFLKSHIGPKIGRVRIVELQPWHVEKMMEAMDASKVTKINVRAFLRSAINAVALKGGVVSRNVAALADPPRKGKPTVKRPTITPETLSAILAAEDCPIRRTLYLTIATTGLRVGEARGLTWHELVEREDGYWIHLRESKTDQGLQPVPVPSETWKEIEALGKSSLYVFPTSQGTAIDHSNLRRSWQECLRKAGLPASLHLYGLRKYFGSIHARRVNDVVLKRLMRHTDVRTTKQYYTTAFDEDLRKAVEN
jgi:integrase